MPTTSSNDMDVLTQSAYATKPSYLERYIDSNFFSISNMLNTYIATYTCKTTSGGYL